MYYASIQKQHETSMLLLWLFSHLREYRWYATLYKFRYGIIFCSFRLAQFIKSNANIEKNNRARTKHNNNGRYCTLDSNVVRDDEDERKAECKMEKKKFTSLFQMYM